MSLLLDCSYPWGPNLWVSKRCMLVAVGQHTQDKARQGLKDFTGKDVTRHGFRQLFTHWKEDSPRPPCLHTQEDYPEMKGNEWLMLWCSPWLEMWECSWVILDSDISAALFQGSQGREPHSYHGPGVIRICLMPAHPGSQTNNGRWPHGSVQSFSRVWLIATPWTAAYQASLSITNSWSLLKLMSIELMMDSSSVIPFSSHLRFFPASGSLQMSRFFTSDVQSIGVSP